MFAEIVPIMFEKDAEKKKEALAKFQNDSLPGIFGNFEKVITRNGGDFFFGNEVGIQLC